jgi:DNA-binding beta-propeller fold protein YncE
MLVSKQKSVGLLAAIALAARLAAPMALPADSSPGQTWQGPAALARSPEGRQFFAACARAHRILVLNSETLVVTASIALPDRPTGLALSTNGRTLYVTCAAPAGSLLVLDIPQRKVLRRIPAGHNPADRHGGTSQLTPNQLDALIC